jgi:hypothetical protein
MDACTVETGLLKKKPCGEQAVTKCGNCEQALCKKHAVPQTSAGQRKAGGFLCPECAKAWKAQEKAMGPIGASGGAHAAAPAKPAAAPSKPAAASPPAAHKPAEPAKAPAAKAPAPKAAPAAKKSEPPPPEDSAPLEFTVEPKKPDDKK